MKYCLKLRHNLSSALRSPINPELLKTAEGRAEIQKRLEQRFKSEHLLHATINQYQIFRKELHHFEKLSQECNQIKQKIKTAIKQKIQNDDLQNLKNTLSTAKKQLSRQQELLKDSKVEYERSLQQIGNEVHPDTPIAQDQIHNRTIKYYHPHHKSLQNLGNIKDHEQLIKQYFKSESKKINYQKLTEMFGIADLPRGQKVSGHRGYFLCNNGVKLSLGLAQYGLDFLESKGYSLYQTPALILESVLLDSCQLSSIETDMYRYKQDELCLIATSEQSLAGYHKAQTFEPKQLPKRMAGYSTCFRREAGAHGKDIHGLFRVHQFEKVEQFVVCSEEDSWKMMEEMIKNAEQFYQSLDIPYRLVDIVSGQLNDPAARKIDLEAWYPGQQKFRQLVSISNCTDYQARMLEIKYRVGQSVRYPHMLNGTLTAIQRTITCLLEHFYCSRDEVLRIPLALQPYVRTDVLKKYQI